MNFDSPQTAWRQPSTPSTPRSVSGPRPRTASQILAAFSPKPQLNKSPSRVSSSPQAFPITMMADRRLRAKKQPVSYEISSDDENTDSQVDSSFSSPANQPSRKRSIIDLEDDFEEIEPPKTPPPRLSAAGHSLRQHGALKLSLQARENADKPRLKKRKISNYKPKQILIPSASKAPAQQRTARNEIRDFINTETAGKRARFFLAKKELFLPLLPEVNHIQKLSAQQGPGAIEESVPYESIKTQPVG